MKPTKRKTTPVAPAHISREINRLAEIRAMMKELMEKSKGACKKIIAFGSCHNEDWRAYVNHHKFGIYTNYSKAHDSVKLMPMKKEK